MVGKIDQEYNVGEKPTVTLYTYIIDRHACRDTKQTKTNVVVVCVCVCVYLLNCT